MSRSFPACEAQNYLASFATLMIDRIPMKLFPVIAALALLLASCQTTTTTTNRVSIGMNQADVLQSVGKPFSKSAEVVDGVSVETWIYKETTWDQGGWSWNRTVSDSEIVFRNGRVVSFGVAKERHLHERPGDINVNVHHDE
jgi:hypothetical protein